MNLTLLLLTMMLPSIIARMLLVPPWRTGPPSCTPTKGMPLKINLLYMCLCMLFSPQRRLKHARCPSTLLYLPACTLLILVPPIRVRYPVSDVVFASDALLLCIWAQVLLCEAAMDACTPAITKRPELLEVDTLPIRSRGPSPTAQARGMPIARHAACHAADEGMPMQEGLLLKSGRCRQG